MTFKNAFFLTALLTIILAAGCDKDDNNITDQGDYTDIIANLTDNVIIATYQDLDAKAGALVNTLTILENDPTTANLDAAKQAWRDARLPWEQSEGFLYGPVDFSGLDPALDSWPVNETDLENVLNSSATLTKDYIDSQDGTLKGFHTIEYLLFGTDANKQVADFTSRQFEYLRACGQSLKGTTQQLHEGWLPSHGNFGKNFKEAGTSNSIYPSQKAVLEEIVNGLVTIADEVANGKINEPFSQQNLTLEESRFSANSKMDFADNIRSIKNIYNGTYINASGKGIAELIADSKPELNAKIKQQIDDAINAIAAIQGTFTTAIFNSPETVQNAQQKVRVLLDTLQAELLPVISNL